MTSTVDGAPLFYVVNQHIGWLKQYILGMDESNWRDMRLRAERQLDGLSEEIDKIAAVQRCDAGSAKAYVERAIASYAGDPADNQFQKGFLAALEVVRDGAFLSAWRTDFENAPSPCLGWCTPPSGDEVRQIWHSSYNKGQWSAHGCTQTVKAWQPLPSLPATTLALSSADRGTP